MFCIAESPISTKGGLLDQSHKRGRAISQSVELLLYHNLSKKETAWWNVSSQTGRSIFVKRHIVYAHIWNARSNPRSLLDTCCPCFCVSIPLLAPSKGQSLNHVGGVVKWESLTAAQFYQRLCARRLRDRVSYIQPVAASSPRPSVFSSLRIFSLLSSVFSIISLHSCANVKPPSLYGSRACHFYWFLREIALMQLWNNRNTSKCRQS